MTRLWRSFMSAFLAGMLCFSVPVQAEPLTATDKISARAGFAVALERGADLLGSLDASDFARYNRTPSKRNSAPVYSREFLAAIPYSKGNKEWRCLTEALYFEARGESVRGQFAVAEVILNRRDSARFPDTLCGVINQGTGQKFRCQFTYTCDGRAENVTDQKSWQQLGKIARLMMDGAPRDLTSGATFYHTKAVRPKWARVFTNTTTIGVHKFYRREASGANS